MTRALVCASILVMGFVNSFAQSPNAGAQNLNTFFNPQTPSQYNALSVARYFFPVNPDLPLDGPIDPDVFICGPNDLLSVSVGGATPIQQVIPVSADGLLLIPGIEPIRAAGRSLRAVKNDAESQLRRLIGNHPVEVALSQPRTFTVTVFGGTPNPGIQQVSAVLATTRVAALVFRAIAEPNVLQKNLSFGYRPSIRTIEIRRRNGEVLYPDLARFNVTGDLKYNPALQEGDQVFIPAYHYVNEAVNVQGDIPYAGYYPLRPDDSLLDLLWISAGPNHIGKLTTVRVTRFSETGAGQSQEYNVASILAKQAPNPKLSARDLIYVPQRGRDNGMIYIDGEITYPGPYPMTSDRTTLRELIRMSGGLRTDALQKGAYIERMRNASESNNPFSLPAIEGGGNRTPVPAEKGRLGDLSYASRLYLQREMTLNSNRIAVNLETALQPNAPDVYLFDGDRLLIPRDQRKVMILGEVVQRGLIDWHPNQTVDAYVQQAGGKGINATKIYVIKVGTNELVDAYKTTIESGDTIFVDRKPDLADSAELQTIKLQEQNARIQRLSFFITLGTTALATITTILSLVRSN